MTHEYLAGIFFEYFATEHSSRCLDNEEDRAAVAVALAEVMLPLYQEIERTEETNNVD